jgi:CopG antitoxin of type II toxin-antitoxin system
MPKSRVKEQRDPLPEQFNNVEETVEFWDTHSLADYEESWKDVQCEIDIKRRTYQISLDSGIYQKLRSAARERGVSAETLVNLWLQEKVS